jgi:transcriptional regulatory protein LevR
MSRSQLGTARQILADVRQRLAKAAHGNERFVFLLRRYISKNLSYDERGNPQQRTKLKLQKLIEQKGKCAYANCPTPDRPMTKEDEPELDRIEAIKRYTKGNTVLVHHDCHRMSQKEKGFA